jgi:hypothetical protein
LNILCSQSRKISGTVGDEAVANLLRGAYM